MSLLGTNTVTQIAFVVRDIEKAAQKWAKLLGVDPSSVIVTGPLEETNATYLGEPMPSRAKLCFLSAGQVQIELIEPDGRPSTWQRHLTSAVKGVHHIAFGVKGMADVVQQLSEAGYPEIQRGDYTGGCYSYIDTTKGIGHSARTARELLVEQLRFLCHNLVADPVQLKLDLSLVDRDP